MSDYDDLFQLLEEAAKIVQTIKYESQLLRGNKVDSSNWHTVDKLHKELNNKLHEAVHYYDKYLSYFPRY